MVNFTGHTKHKSSPIAIALRPEGRAGSPPHTLKTTKDEKEEYIRQMLREHNKWVHTTDNWRWGADSLLDSYDSKFSPRPKKRKLKNFLNAKEANSVNHATASFFT